MDQFKTIWTKMKAKKDAECGEDGLASLELSGTTSGSGGTGSGEVAPSSTNGFAPQGPIVLRHNQLAPKHPSDHTNILLDVDTFQALGKMQPFTVSISSSALLVLDLHSHMVKEPVFLVQANPDHSKECKMIHPFSFCQCFGEISCHSQLSTHS